MSISLRPATAADAAAVAQVWLDAFDAALPTVTRAHDDDDVRRWFREVVLATRECWVAVDGAGAVVGILALSDTEIEQLYVAPDRQGRGIGTALIDVAKERRTGGLALWTFQINTRARAFYGRHGFRELFTTDGADNEEREPDVRLAWP